ncbi:hypothetical protein H0H93_004444, partial [Arthromyces matolae]
MTPPTTPPAIAAVFIWEPDPEGKLEGVALVDKAELAVASDVGAGDVLPITLPVPTEEPETVTVFAVPPLLLLLLVPPAGTLPVFPDVEPLPVAAGLETWFCVLVGEEAGVEP